MKIRIVQNAPFPRITQFTFSVDRLRKLAVVACEFPRGALSPILTCNAPLRIRELAILADAARDCIVRNTKFSRDTVGAYSVRKQRGVCGDELAGGANGPLRTGREPETCELASLADGALDGVVRGTKFSLNTFGAYSVRGLRAVCGNEHARGTYSPWMTPIRIYGSAIFPNGARSTILIGRYGAV